MTSYNRRQFAILTSVVAGAFQLMCSLPVVAGDSPLAPIRLTPERRQLIGLKFANVERKRVSDHLETTGTIEADERLTSFVQTRFAGWIERVYANTSYQYVRKGQPLFTIYSPDLVSTENEYLLALAARKRVKDSSLGEVGADAASLVDSAADRLRLFGVSAREIARLERERTVRHAIEIDSPVSGFIVERDAQPNKYVQPDTRLFTITDLSKVWIYAAVFQNELGKVRPGDLATVTVDAYPGETFTGKVDFIQPQIDMATRTARVRCELLNSANKLYPGMYARVALELAMGEQLVVPASAVLSTGSHSVAFVDRSDGLLTPVQLDLGSRVGDEYIVLKGLTAGQRVVSSANFLIDSESQLQAASGAYAPPAPGVGANSSGESMPGIPQASLDFSSDPSPLTRGHNRMTITLRDSHGTPITGAKVTVSFYMAAMPAMGMAAMRIDAAAIDKGKGAYVAQFELQSGGTWSLTISASKDGQTIATRQMNISATGAMSM